MAETKRSRKTFKGAVLIMVITVMLVLMIMLLATLTVVSTANQRSYLKFEENQAYYSARSALDLYVSSLFADNIYKADGQQYTYTDLSTGSQKTIDMKQGLALQLELYKLKSLDTTLGIASNMKKTDNVFPNAAENNNYCVDDLYTLDYITYQVELPKVSNDDNGKMVDKDSTTGKQMATIKVQVLKRAYNMAGIEVKDYQFVGTAPTNAQIKAGIAAGNRSKDAMQIKITSTVELMGVEGVASVIADTAKKEVVSTKNALTSVGGLNDVSGAQLTPVGGASTLALNPVMIGDGNTGSMSGTLFTIGTFNWNTSQSVTTLSSGECITVMGNMTLSPTDSAKLAATDNGTFIFVGGELQTGSKIGSTTGSKKMNVVAHKLTRMGANPSQINGNVYVDTLDLSSENNDQFEITGTVYVKNIILNHNASANSNSAISVDTTFKNIGSVKLCPGYTITCNGKIYDSTYNLEDVLLGTYFSKFSTTSDNAFDVNSFSIVEKDGRIYREYTLGGNLADTSDNKILVPTAQSYFSEYFQADAFQAWGDLKNFNKPNDSVISSADNAYTTIYNPLNIEKWQISATNLLNTYLELDGADKYASVNDAATKLGATKLPSGSVTIDLSSGDKYYTIDGNNAQTSINVTGEGGRLILLIPENQTAWFEKLSIETADVAPGKNIVDGTTKAPPVDIYGGTGSKLETQNNSYIAAYIKMPTGKIKLPTANTGTCNYTNSNGNTTTGLNPVVVGSVLCGSIDTANQGGFLFLDPESGASAPGEPHLTIKPYYYVR